MNVFADRNCLLLNGKIARCKQTTTGVGLALASLSLFVLACLLSLPTKQLATNDRCLQVASCNYNEFCCERIGSFGGHSS